MATSAEDLAIKVVEQLMAAFNRRDRGAVADLLDDDVICAGIPLDPAVGKAAAMDLLDPFLSAEQIDWEVLAVAAKGRTVFTERIDRFRFAGREWTAVRAAGRSAGACLFRWRRSCGRSDARPRER